MGSFDGATLNGMCGAGFVIKLGDDKVMKGWLKNGIGTNTRAEVAGLWCLLFYAKYWGIKD